MSVDDNLITTIEEMTLATSTIPEMDDEVSGDIQSYPTATVSSSSSSPEDMVVVVVDPYSTGCLIVKEIMKRGYSVIALWTTGFSAEMKTHVPKSVGAVMYHAEIDQNGASIAETAILCRNACKRTNNKSDLVVVAVMAGGEAGVDCADALSEYMELRTNGTDIPNRRDKKLQQELVRDFGLRSVRQAGGTEISEVEEFLLSEPYPIVLKPVESAGSDGVKLCHDIKEAKDHFNVLMKSQMVNGGACPAVLCQEFLKGKEYVVDHVSRDGVHKTCMVWVYDKRPANGSAFVYFGCDPVDTDSEVAKLIIPYIRGVLDAIGFKNGPSHGEVMMTETGPCLVEMNCRARGGDGNWRSLCRALTGGYSQVEASVDCFLDEAAFKRMPDKPPSPFKASGQEVILVSFSRGVVKSTPGYDVLKNLPSFVYLETGVIPGAQVDYTIDLVTGIGSVILMHHDSRILQRDVDFIRYMEQINGFFVYETKLESLNRPTGDNVVLDSILSPPTTDKTKVGDHKHQRVFSSEGPMLIRHMSNDRPELRGPLMKRMTTIDSSKEAVVIVDPYSTGCCIAEEIQKRGYTMFALWTKGFAPEMKLHVPLSVGKIIYKAELDEADTLVDTASLVYKTADKLRVIACIAGGEAGVDLADALSERLKVRTNGTRIPNKRDKKLQQELIKEAGLRSVRQACGSTFAEVESFLQTEPFPVVLKPVESAGSDGVKLCHTIDEAKEHFNLLMSSQMVNGGACPAVLCQEFLRGKEYVVDHASRDGKHKTVMVWVYDKRPANGSAFVYFGCVPIDSESPEAKILIPYVRRVLDALDIKNGPSHGEVMMTNDGPCLVEMNCRAHGGDGNWRSLCRALNGGYSQVESAVDSYLDSRQFLITPDKSPSPFKASGQEVILVSYSRGVVKSTPGFAEIEKFESFVYLETGVRPGSFVDYTVDLFTGVGSVILMHEDDAVLQRDVNRIRQMEIDNLLFEYDLESHTLKSSVHQSYPVVSTSDRSDMY
jgi:biotin carboxylase